MSINSPATIKNGMIVVCEEAAEELLRNGTAIPDIMNVIFNETKTKTRAVRDENGNLVIDPQTNKPRRETVDIHPTLATTVYFADGSKVTVTNSAKDTVVDAEGNFTHEAYERGIIYAIVKRVFSKYGCNKKTGKFEVQSEGFGRRLNELVANAYNVPKAEAARKAAKEAAHKAHLEREAAAKQNPRRASLGQTVAELAKTVADLSAVVESLTVKQEA